MRRAEKEAACSLVSLEQEDKRQENQEELQGGTAKTHKELEGSKISSLPPSGPVVLLMRPLPLLRLLP